MGLRLAKKKNNKPKKGKPSWEIKEDARKILEVAEWNRIRLIINHEALHQAWGYPLYALHRAGKITDDQREAGDAYWRVVDDHFKMQRDHDLDEVPEIGREFVKRRIEKAKDKYHGVTQELGIGKKFLDALIFDHEYPTTEKQLKLTIACLEKLTYYFGFKRSKPR